MALLGCNSALHCLLPVYVRRNSGELTLERCDLCKSQEGGKAVRISVRGLKLDFDLMFLFYLGSGSVLGRVAQSV